MCVIDDLCAILWSNKFQKMNMAVFQDLAPYSQCADISEYPALR